MPPRVRRRSQPPGRETTPSASGPIDRNAWLAPPVGVLVIVVLAFGASLAQATQEIFLAASLLFSLCEGVVLAIVGFVWWSRRGIAGAILAAAVTAAVAAPVRWEVTILTRYGQLVPQSTDLLSDLLLSIIWGAFAGLAGATVLRPRLAGLMRDTQARFTARPPR